jgi:hypothetical protein
MRTNPHATTIIQFDPLWRLRNGTALRSGRSPSRCFTSWTVPVLIFGDDAPGQRMKTLMKPPNTAFKFRRYTHIAR